MDWTSKCITGYKKSGQNRGRGHQIFTPNKIDFTFQAPNHYAKFHENRIKVAAVGATTGTLTDRQTDASDFISCSMLCYSSGTDDNVR